MVSEHVHNGILVESNVNVSGTQTQNSSFKIHMCSPRFILEVKLIEVVTVEAPKLTSIVPLRGVLLSCRVTDISSIVAIRSKCASNTAAVASLAISPLCSPAKFIYEISMHCKYFCFLRNNNYSYLEVTLNIIRRS